MTYNYEQDELTRSVDGRILDVVWLNRTAADGVGELLAELEWLGEQLSEVRRTIEAGLHSILERSGDPYPGNGLGDLTTKIEWMVQEVEEVRRAIDAGIYNLPQHRLDASTERRAQ